MLGGMRDITEDRIVERRRCPTRPDNATAPKLIYMVSL